MTPVAPSYNYSWAKCGNIGGSLGTGCGAIPLTADAAQGQTTIQVTSTSGFSVGQWVLIDEASGAGWVADPLNAVDRIRKRVGRLRTGSSSSGSPATGRVMWSKSQNGGGWDFGSTFPYQANSVGCWHSYCDRPTAELHKIASIGSRHPDVRRSAHDRFPAKRTTITLRSMAVSIQINQGPVLPFHSSKMPAWRTFRFCAASMGA